MFQVGRTFPLRGLSNFSKHAKFIHSGTRPISSRSVTLHHRTGSVWQPGIVISSKSWQLASVRLAGHSKWANIRHTKGAKDAEKSMTAAKMVQKINVAILEGGGSDPKYNRQLERVYEEALGKNVPKATVEAAIKRAREKKEANQKHIMCAVGPGSCFLLIECLTSTVTKTKQELTGLIKKNGAKVADMKMASYSFSLKGVLHIPVEGCDTDRAEELAIEAGAEEVSKDKNDDGQEIWKFVCDPMDMASVKKSLEAEKIDISFCRQEYIATTYQKVDAVHREQLNILYDKLESHDGVVQIYDNIDMN